jgi:hypothetical protein
MKIKHPLQARWARRFAAGLVLVFLAVAVFWLRNAIGQQPSLPKLTLIQIEQLVSQRAGLRSGCPDRAARIGLCAQSDNG